MTTLAGLIVAIPAAVASHYFEGKITRIFGAIEELSAELMMRLECYEGRTRFEPIGRELAARDLTQGGVAIMPQPSIASVIPPPASRGIAKPEQRPRSSQTVE